MNNAPTLKIESNVPLPKNANRKYNVPSTVRRTLELMNVGDSFEIHREEIQLGSLFHCAKRAKVQICTRQTNCVTRRVWRLA